MIETYPYFFTKDSKPHFLQVIPSKTHEIITLNATKDDDLKWDEAKCNLASLQLGKQKALIKLDLGLERSFSFDNQLDMSSYIIAIEQFNKTIFSEFTDVIDGVIFYEGSSQLEINCPLDDTVIADHLSDELSQNYDIIMKNRMASAGILGSILHRLVSFLDDRCLPFIIFNDAIKMTPIDRAIFFSKERFDHVLIIAHNPDFQYITLDLESGMSSLGCYGSLSSSDNADIKKALLFPSDAMLDAEVYKHFEGVLNQMIQDSKRFRLIGEKMFNECWNDIDTAIYSPKSVHHMTLRMIRGFEASGGEAIEI